VRTQYYSIKWLPKEGGETEVRNYKRWSEACAMLLWCLRTGHTVTGVYLVQP